MTAPTPEQVFHITHWLFPRFTFCGMWAEPPVTKASDATCEACIEVNARRENL